MMSPELAVAAGRYELRERLSLNDGHAVWRALDRQDGIEVVVKLLVPERLADDNARRRLQAEADAVGRLGHPNIVPLLAAHFSAAEAALVFPLVDGHTLAERLADGTTLSPLESARLGSALASALAHAHAAGVAHRDVKPANILLGSDGAPRLLDFGIAATPDAGAPAGDARHAAVPGRRTVLGTLPYMAPEHLAAAPAHPASDVYSLAVVLYEALAGKRPFEAISPQSMVEEQRRQPAAIAGVPPDLLALIMAGLEPDPLRRPTAAALSTQLEGWTARPSDVATVAMVAASMPVEAAPPAGGGGRAGGMLLAGLVVLLAVAVSGAFLVGLGQAGPAAPSPTESVPGLGADHSTPAATEPSVVVVNEPADGGEPAPAAKPDRPGKKKDDRGKGGGKGRGGGGPGDDDDDDEDEDEDED